MTENQPGLERRCVRAFRRLAARCGLAIVVVGVTAFVVSAGLTLLRPGLPSVHDEFSYLLAGDTFAAGRLSNPAHPLWEHFESFHILASPSHASKYPPGQGLFLALGQRLTGRPIVGVWLSVSLGCAAVCWMLQGWTRPPWALLGGFLAAFHHGIHGGVDWLSGGQATSWSQRYWGGGVAMLGGALVFGAMPRLIRRPGPRNAMLLALGLVTLANSRPFEGLLVSLPVAIAILLGWIRHRPGPVRLLFTHVVVPMALVLVPAGAAMATYNTRVTGHPFVMPYGVYEKSYSISPIFPLLQKPRPVPDYHHDVMRRFYTEYGMDQYLQQHSPASWFAYHRERMIQMWSFFVGALILPLLMLPWVLRIRPMRFAAGCCLLLVAAHLPSVGIQPQYAAPVMGLYLLLVVQGLRFLQTVRIGPRRAGRTPVYLTLGLAALFLGATAWNRAHHPDGWEADRAKLLARLEASEGRHLVVVRYATDHNPHAEWVYNRADIDAGKVVWARAIDRERDERLLRYFADRRAWLLEPDTAPVTVVPYGRAGSLSEAASRDRLGKTPRQDASPAPVGGATRHRGTSRRGGRRPGRGRRRHCRVGSGHRSR
jgi:hypothetical protein